MPDWVIIIVAAFGGGLGGAVLQPVTSHLLERLRSGEEIRRTRERQLRRMVQTRMEWSRVRGIALAAWAYRSRLGFASPSVSEIISRRSNRPPPSPVWRPDRIPDPILRQKATEYEGAFFEVDLRAFIQTAPDMDLQELHTLLTRMDELESEIVRRMDELGWPEGDE